MDIIISIITKLTIEDIHFQSNKSMRYMKLVHVLIFDSAVICRRVILQVRFSLKTKHLIAKSIALNFFGYWKTKKEILIFFRNNHL